MGNSLGESSGGKESSVGKERYGSDDRVDGGGTMGNSLGRALWGRSEMEATEKVDGGETVGNSMG